jgi:hypothetical protein
MTGSWREILESAAADRADDRWSVSPGEARRQAGSQGAEQTASAQLHPAAGRRGFDEPELAAFLTRLASPPDTTSAALAEDGPAAAGSGPALGRERPAGKSPAVAVTAAVPRAGPEKAAPFASTPPPRSRKRRASRDLLATMLLAAALGLTAYALLSPGVKKPDTSQSAQSPSAISASRVQVEGRPASHRSRTLRARHRRTDAGRGDALKRCRYEPDLPGCRWQRYQDW